MREPFACVVKNGKGLNALTGLLTPPGMCFLVKSFGVHPLLFFAFKKKNSSWKGILMHGISISKLRWKKKAKSLNKNPIYPQIEEVIE